MEQKSFEEIKKLADEFKISLEGLDFNAIWDSKLSEEENVNAIKGVLRRLSGIKEEEKPKPITPTRIKGKEKKTPKEEKEEAEKVNFDKVKKEIEQTEAEFKKSLEALQSNNSILEKLYWLPKEYIRAIVSNNTELYGLIETGKAGLSKSYSTIQTLKELLVDFVYFCGYTTPLGLYEFLYENKDKGRIIVFDDTRGVLNNPTSISMMINALYSNGGLPRKINWTSSKLKKLPPEFNFEAKVILITNELPKGMEVINSRCLNYNFEFNNFEIIAIMKAIAELHSDKLTKEQRLEIVKFIETNTDETTENLDLRTQNKIEQLYLYNKDTWKDLSMPLITTKNKNLVLLKKFIAECKTLAEAKQKFYEATGMGERTFQRYNLKLKEATTRQSF